MNTQKDNLDGLQTCKQCGARVTFDRDGFCPICLTRPCVESQVPPPIEDSIRQILLHDWRPIAFEVPSDEYDAYIPPIYRILVGSRSEDELTKYLFATTRDTIGACDDTVEHFELCRPVARKLLELDFRV
jgi:hypothetical protein